MLFTFSEQHITEYYHNGYTVFQSILPSSLVQDLRRVTGLAREIIREENGPQVQRLQPVRKYADRLDMRPFQDYEELPELMDAYQRVLSPMHRLEGKARMGILFEPADQSWCTVWHRDITAKTNHLGPMPGTSVITPPTVNAPHSTTASGSRKLVPGTNNGFRGKSKPTKGAVKYN